MAVYSTVINYNITYIYLNQINGCGNPVGDQKYSGRCWIFACLNVVRVPFMKYYNIKKFEFSQAHMFFWDKVPILIQYILIHLENMNYYNIYIYVYIVVSIKLLIQNVLE